MTTCALVLGALFCVPPVLSDEINVKIATTVKCLDRNTFTTQGKIGDFEVILDAVLYCPDGYVCQEGSNYPCTLDPNPPSSTTTTTTSTSTPLTTPGPPACFEHGFWPGPTCQEYYECVSKWWWWEPALRQCEEGKYFSDEQKTCVPKEEKQSTISSTSTIASTTIKTTTLTTKPVTITKTNPTTTSTTKRPTITEPDCKYLGCFPGPKCDQFYECVPIWWWAKPIIRNCPQNYHFDKPTSCNCIPKQLSKCTD